MKKCSRDDAGFTLLEIIISIAILALLMVPALSSYVSAAKVNRNARIYQRAATLGQNLMEAVKTGEIDEVAMTFNGVGSFGLINNNLTGFIDTYRLKTYTDGGYGEYYFDAGSYHRVLAGDAQSSIKLAGSPPIYTFSPPGGRGSYLFGIQNIEDSGSRYDVLITLDAMAYRDSVKYPDIYNNFKMPDLAELNQNEVTMLVDSSSSDEQAFWECQNIWLSYLIYLDGISAPAPAVLYSDDDIKNAISKEIRITVQKDSIKNTVQIECNTEYTCSLDLNGDGTGESIHYDLYTESSKVSGEKDYDREIYLLYKPSDFLEKDTISIINDGAKGKLVIAKQDGAPLKETIIKKTELNLASTQIYTNLSASELDAASLPNITEHNLISKEEAKDRIYNSKVAVYKAGSIVSGDLSKPYATFTSTVE